MMKSLILFFLVFFQLNLSDACVNHTESDTEPILTDSVAALKFYNNGLVLIQSKDFKGAFECFTKAIELKGNFAEAYLKRGIVSYKAKIYKDLWSDYDMAIKLKPDYGEAYYERGMFKNQIDGKVPATAGNEDLKKAKELGYKPF